VDTSRSISNMSYYGLLACNMYIPIVDLEEYHLFIADMVYK
jgi:hypothetical protein